MDEVVTQEHERTVSGARLSMMTHDDATMLRRWFDNYKDDKNAIFLSGWCVVTRDGGRYKVEFGYGENNTPARICYVDPRAPEPPLFEFRPPKPEPVKHRERSMEPLRVPSWARGELSYRAVMAMQVSLEVRAQPLRYEYERRAYDRWMLFDRPTFDRVAAPPPPPPTRRNQ